MTGTVKGTIKEGKKTAHPYQKIPGLHGKASPRRDLQKDGVAVSPSMRSKRDADRLHPFLSHS